MVRIAFKTLHFIFFKHNLWGTFISSEALIYFIIHLVIIIIINILCLIIIELFHFCKGLCFIDGNGLNSLCLIIIALCHFCKGLFFHSL